MAVNVHRRALSLGQRRELVHAELERDPSRSDRAIGRLCGVDGKTVAAMRVRNSASTEEFTPERIAEAEERTERICAGLAAIDADVAALVAGGWPLEAVRLLTTGMDMLLGWRPDDAEWQAGIRIIFEPRIREALSA